MLDWLAEEISSLMALFPALFVGESSPSFHLIRTMFGLIFIVVCVFIVAKCPSPSTIGGYLRKASSKMVRKK
jgi:hypothetical protein